MEQKGCKIKLGRWVKRSSGIDLPGVPDVRYEMELSCDYDQGYFYSKPIRVEEVEKKYSKSAGKER